MGFWAIRTEAAIMGLAKVFEPFIEKRPACVMARAILERVFDPARIDALFAKTAVVGYTRALHFSALVHLMGDVVLGVHPSVHAAFQAPEEGDAAVSLTAVYSKLDRVETAVSAALVRDAAQQVAPVIDALGARLDPWLPGYRCRVLDGNHLSATEHRIRALRTTWAAPLPGKALVVLDPERMLADDVFLTQDGHAQERSLLDEVLAGARPRDLWIADRNFCTTAFLFGLARRQASFVIRQHGTVKGELVGPRREIGPGATGTVSEQGLALRDPRTGETAVFRRLTVQLGQPTRDGDDEIHLLSNVPEGDADAPALAALYRRRWTIETVFQEVTTTLRCELDTLGYPKAALFAFCLALVAFNAVSLLKAALRGAHGATAVTEDVSGYYLNLEVRGTYQGMMIAIPDVHWASFRTLSVAELASTLREIAGHLQLARYRKHPRGPKKPPPKKAAYANGGHVSTFKLLNRNE
jgi:hypothetical protein